MRRRTASVLDAVSFKTVPANAGAMVTLKNVLGILGLAVIALFWVIITKTWLGGAFVAVLIVVVAVVLRREQTRKRPEPQPKADDAVR